MNNGQSFTGPLFFSILFIVVLLLLKGCGEESESRETIQKDKTNLTSRIILKESIKEVLW